MSTLGNILWLILGGLIVALAYMAVGLLVCCTIIGIPFGIQLIQLGAFALKPFGREVTFKQNAGCLSLVFSVLWIVCGWWEIAIVHLILACVLAITIIGIPFAKAHWRLMKLSFMPAGLTWK
ncbi:MAG: YccF domain-containing protein [Bacteroidia bacterium]|nr:YccF domain-containing protein [Bacteroidia bacterium]